MEAALPVAGEAVIQKRWNMSAPAFEPTTASIASSLADHALKAYLKRFPNQVVGKATRAIAVGDDIYFTDI